MSYYGQGQGEGTEETQSELVLSVVGIWSSIDLTTGESHAANLTEFSFHKKSGIQSKI